jgi:hypothetical protein
VLSSAEFQQNSPSRNAGAVFVGGHINRVMIAFCPHCGHRLRQPILHGITSCSNCHRIFDSSALNRVLSASWLARKKQVQSEDALMSYGYTQSEAELVIKYVIESHHTHEEFVRILTELGIPEQKVPVDLAS